MASFSLGAPNITLLRLDSSGARTSNRQQWNGVRTWMGRKQLKYVGLTVSHETKKTFSVRCSPSVEAQAECLAAANTADDSQVTEASSLTSPLIPNSAEIESLVCDICNTTSIAEFELKLDGFRLYVTRDIAENSRPTPQLSSIPAAAPPAASPQAQVNASTGSNGPASTSIIPAKPATLSGGIQSFLEIAADEGIVIVKSPKVGYFQKCRVIKGKLLPPSCEEGKIVKVGQMVCFIEQLGRQTPVQSDVSGEIIRILHEDGDSVGYGDPLIAILPSFPGIKLH